MLFYNAQSEFYDEGSGSSSPSRSYISTIVAIFCSVGPVSLRSQSYCLFSVMVLQRRILHPRGLSLSMQSRVYALRKSSKPPPAWTKIARQVRNRQGKMPYWKVCRDVYNKLKNPVTVDSDGYNRCGRKSVLTKFVRKWLVKRLLVLRRSQEVTSKDLQAELARDQGITVEDSSVRKALHTEGYKYLTRAKKPKYTAPERAIRVAFAERISCEKVHLCLDGVVFTVPPKGPAERENYCKADVSRVWRRPDEHDLPELAGYDNYAKQVPTSRIVPLWGGVRREGFASVLWHGARKTDQFEWAKAVQDGKLLCALKKVNPETHRPPWKILCDNERFLRARESIKAYRPCKIELLKLPSKSPDLNPVEKMWGWARKKLRRMDLADLKARRPVLAKIAYRE